MKTKFESTVDACTQMMQQVHLTLRQLIPAISSSTNKSTDSQDSTQELTPKQLTTFEIFSELPLEIRRDVWRYALAVPRIIGVQHSLINEADYFEPKKTFHAIQHVCQEARIEALLVLTSCLGDCGPAARVEGSNPEIVSVPKALGLINPDIDILWIKAKDEKFVRSLYEHHYPTTPAIKRLAMDYRIWIDISKFTHKGDSERNKFKELWFHEASEFILVTNGHEAVTCLPNTIFITPSLKPYDRLHASIWSSDAEKARVVNELYIIAHRVGLDAQDLTWECIQTMVLEGFDEYFRSQVSKFSSM
jgi:hypothetical protein